MPEKVIILEYVKTGATVTYADAAIPDKTSLNAYLAQGYRVIETRERDDNGNVLSKYFV